MGVSLVASLALTAYLVYYWALHDPCTKVALVLTIPGAIGNLLDRALQGTVTDFLSFLWFDLPFLPKFVNNLADCFISVGVVFFALAILIQPKLAGATPEQKK